MSYVIHVNRRPARRRCPLCPCCFIDAEEGHDVSPERCVCAVPADTEFSDTLVCEDDGRWLA